VQPVEPTSSKPENRLKHKGQILGDYKLSLRTIEDLLARGLLKGKPKAAKGKIFIEIDNYNDFILRSAANDIFSFKSAHTDVPVLPFHRFLCLRFVNTTALETYNELTGIGVIGKTSTLKKSNITRYYAQFLRKCPVEIRSFIADRMEPIKKTDLRLFRTFLDVVGVLGYYDAPGCFDDLSFFIEHRDDVEPIMTTISSAEQVAEAVSKMTGYEVPAAIMGIYRTMLYATHDMQPHDRSVYFASLPPRERQLRSSAAGLRIYEFMVRSGMDGVCEHRIVLDELQKIAQLGLAQTSRLKNDAAIQIARSNLDMFLKIHDRLDLISKSGGKDVARLFDRFLMIPQANGPIETIKDVDTTVKERENTEPGK
jgi:hypothetical protein